MKNFGLRYGEDDDPPKQFEKTDFTAGREKSKFEKNMDDLLGFGPTSRRKPKSSADGSAKKQQIVPKDAPTKTDPTRTNPTKTYPETKTDPTRTNPTKTYPETKTDPTKTNPTKPIKIDPSIKTDPIKPPIVNPVPPIQAPQTQPPIQQPKNTRQNDLQQPNYRVPNPSFNKPAYIRKLKKVAEDFNFHYQNPENHQAYDVVRPKQCLKDTATRQNYPGFEDRIFPPDSYSIGPKYRPELVIWKKPSELYKSPTFGKYIEPNDIQPGSLSSPRFLSVLSCLAEREENIKRLIENQKFNPNGFYYVRLNINGVWRYIPVDHNHPQLQGKSLGARSYNDNEAEIWPAMIEKAYAKAYLGYISFQQNTPRQHYLRDLTGSPVKKYSIENSELTPAIQKALQKGYPILAVAKDKILDLGFNPNFSFSVIRINPKGGLELRCSFGTITEKSKIPINREGIFQLSQSQIYDYLSHILIAETDQLKTTTIQSKHHGSFYSCFTFKISEKIVGTISVSQFDKRLFSKNSTYDYVPFRMILEKKNATEQGLSVYVNAQFSYHSRNLDMNVALNPGSYYIYCIGTWRDTPYDFDITITAKKTVEIQRIYYENFPNLIGQALTEQNLLKGKRSAKGHVEQYILYHEPSNLVLITAKSLIDKSYTHTLNLLQVKFDTLTLLNVAKPEDNFARKNRQELETLKNSYFSSKTWEANLLPEQKYTWVFSSSLDYDPNNFKNWGFK